MQTTPTPPKTKVIKKIKILQPVWKKIKIAPPKFKGKKDPPKFLPPTWMTKKPVQQWNKMFPNGKGVHMNFGNSLLPPNKFGDKMFGNGLFPPNKMVDGKMGEDFTFPGPMKGGAYGGKDMFKQYYVLPQKPLPPPTFTPDPMFFGGINNLEQFYPLDISHMSFSNDDWYGKRMYRPIGKSMPRMTKLLPVKLFNTHSFWHGHHCFPHIHSDPFLILRMNPHLQWMGLEHVAFEMAHKQGRCF